MDKTNQLIFGFQEEWEDFGRRNPVFMERFPRIKAVIDFAMTRHVFFSEPIDKFVLMCGRVCIEDFMEILMCCGNGSAYAAQKILRGFYELAVTLQYLQATRHDLSKSSLGGDSFHTLRSFSSRLASQR